MRRSLAPSYAEGVTPDRKEYDDKLDQKRKLLKRKCDNFIESEASAYFDDSKTKGVDEIRKRLKVDEGEHEAIIRKIMASIFKVPREGYNGQPTQKTLGCRKPGKKRSLWDPYGENALVLFNPPEMSEEEAGRIEEADKQVHVVVDPLLGAVLRPHQREGVKFMYECVTGLKIQDYYGSIMADEMGLGKTLQCIALLWTLLRQSPSGKPTFNKCIIVCPSSLVKNWDGEIYKWLKGRINPLPIDFGGKEVIQRHLESFMNDRSMYASTPVLIISYEGFRLYSDILSKSEIGMVICDEGHRLKNSENQTYQALSRLNCKRRILISGTPIQNDLGEYYSLVNFVNTGLLGTLSEFKKKFENKIVRGRDSMATDAEKKMSEETLKELTAFVNTCMIRRTSALLTKYLPVKYEFVVCCSLTSLQENLYKSIISSKQVDVTKPVNEKAAIGQSFSFITNLKKLCNHPNLIYKKWKNGDAGFEKCAFPSGYDYKSLDPSFSGKMKVLDCLLAMTKQSTDDKYVLISNYTETLDVFEKLCHMRNYIFVRLDGSMSIKNRGKIVTKFNDPADPTFIFLLSSKAGGCGLNLIGANRLVMFDPDWNPANDDQAMARVWRDGQKKTCFVFRFLSTGSIEEKIFQRQTHKKALSSCVVDEEEDVARHFNSGDLKALFELTDVSTSDTHQKINCQRCRNGMEIKEPPLSADTNSDLADWYHTSSDKTKIPDKVFKAVLSLPNSPISFTFFQKSHISEVVKKAPKIISEESDEEYVMDDDDSD
uniref:DNA repair and recombination protein RAD54 n=1 Tax=Rhabditophanes sp. KR3021 TaxID=114890 RepID=A0AC35U0B7_9BILA